MMRNHKIVSTVNATFLLGFVAHKDSLFFINFTFCCSLVNLCQNYTSFRLIPLTGFAFVSSVDLFCSLYFDTPLQDCISLTDEMLHASAKTLHPFITGMITINSRGLTILTNKNEINTFIQVIYLKHLQ